MLNLIPNLLVNLLVKCSPVGKAFSAEIDVDLIGFILKLHRIPGAVEDVGDKHDRTNAGLVARELDRHLGERKRGVGRE